MVTVLLPTGPVGVPVILPFANVNPCGNPVTSIGLFGRIPTPPTLSVAATGISTIFSFFITIESLAVIVGGIVSLGFKLVPLVPTTYD